MCYDQGMLKWSRKTMEKEGVKLESSRCCKQEKKTEEVSLNFSIWAAVFADRTMKRDYVSLCETKLFPRPPRTNWKGCRSYFTGVLGSYNFTQASSLRKSISSSPYQNHLINTHLSEGGPCPLGDYNRKTSKPGSNKQKDIINIDNDEECIFCKPHCHQREQFVVITDLSWIQISDPKAPLSGCYFQSP